MKLSERRADHEVSTTKRPSGCIGTTVIAGRVCSAREKADTIDAILPVMQRMRRGQRPVPGIVCLCRAGRRMVPWLGHGTERELHNRTWRSRTGKLRLIGLDHLRRTIDSIVAGGRRLGSPKIVHSGEVDETTCA